MKVNTKIRYGLRTVIEIAKSDDPRRCIAKKILRRTSRYQ